MIYAIAANFDPRGDASHEKRTEGADPGPLAHAPNARLAHSQPVAFMGAALPGGLARVVMEADASPEDLERVRRDRPRACQAYLASADAIG